jgi:hypothetical protein
MRRFDWVGALLLATLLLGALQAQAGRWGKDYVPNVAVVTQVGRDIFFYSISIDPEHDTPQRLKLYADAFQAGPG